MSTANSFESGGNKKSSHNQSRLRMHAPSSIKVIPTSGNMAEWKVAIPLLSPLDIVSIPLIEDHRRLDVSVKERKSEEESAGGGEVREDAGRWRHPAEPFYYEPASAFTIPHCT